MQGQGGTGSLIADGVACCLVHLIVCHQFLLEACEVTHVSGSHLFLRERLGPETHLKHVAVHTATKHKGSIESVWNIGYGVSSIIGYVFRSGIESQGVVRVVITEHYSCEVEHLIGQLF